MQNFLNNFTLNEGLTLSFALLALVVAVASYFNTAQRDRRQIRIGKIEEMIEIILLIMSDYGMLEDIFQLQEKIRNTEVGTVQMETMSLQTTEEEYIAAFRVIANDTKLRDKLIRLSMLSNSYLPNTELKNRVGCLVALVSTLYESTVNKNYQATKNTFETYPKPWTLLEYVKKLQLDLSKEMKLGYESNLFGENPYHEQFKKELGIK